MKFHNNNNNPEQAFRLWPLAVNLLLSLLLLLSAPFSHAVGLDDVYSVSGQPVTLIADGVGSSTGAYSLSLAKPANATLTGWDTDAVQWLGAETFETSYLDVTNEVNTKAVAAGAVAANLSFAIVEDSNAEVIGSGIVAVWSDPASDQNSAIIKLGVQQTPRRLIFQPATHLKTMVFSCCGKPQRLSLYLKITRIHRQMVRSRPRAARLPMVWPHTSTLAQRCV